MIDESLLEILRCPRTGERLEARDGALVSESGERYRVSRTGIPLFAEEHCSVQGRAQQAHYDRVAGGYIANLDYAHTREYTGYLDGAFFDLLGDREPGRAAEICCGRGEAFRLLGDRVLGGVGVDVSLEMLEVARRDLGGCRFVQGDATVLPLADGVFDTVFMMGGVHHVPDRSRLFSEVARVLRPGGMFYFREPANDLFIWRWLRAAVYRLSPVLDHETEHPLRRAQTVEALDGAGLECSSWETYGFLGFAFFMNSDVLVANRLLRFLPGIRRITRLAIGADEATRRLPGLGDAGLQVIGYARKLR